LAANAGFDAQDSIGKMMEEFAANGGRLAVGIDLQTGEPMSPTDAGIWDNYVVKKNMLCSWYVLFNFLVARIFRL
jgi:T-complex protein 1 subunit zeta